MYADAHVAVRERGHGERIVDLGRGDVVDAESLDFRERKIPRRLGCEQRIEFEPAREVLEDETLEVIVVGRRQRATAAGTPARTSFRRLYRVR